MAITTTTPDVLIMQYANYSLDVTVQLAGYKAAQERLLAIPMAEFTAEDVATVKAIWANVTRFCAECPARENLVTPLLTAIQRDALNIHVARIQLLRAEVVALHVALLPRILD